MRAPVKRNVNTPQAPMEHQYNIPTHNAYEDLDVESFTKSRRTTRTPPKRYATIKFAEEEKPRENSQKKNTPPNANIQDEKYAELTNTIKILSLSLERERDSDKVKNERIHKLENKIEELLIQNANLQKTLDSLLSKMDENTSTPQSPAFTTVLSRRMEGTIKKRKQEDSPEHEAKQKPKLHQITNKNQGTGEKENTAPTTNVQGEKEKPAPMYNPSSQGEKENTAPKPTKNTNKKKHGEKEKPALITNVPAQGDNENPAPNAGPPVASIPPVILRTKDKWTTVAKEMEKRNIKYSKAQNTSDGIKIFPSTPDDFRNLTRMFNTDGTQYHTYLLPEEKLLHVVFRGIPVEVKTEDIEEDLKEKGLNPQNIIRMTKGPEKTPMPLVLVLLPKTDKDVFNLTDILRLKITVETQKSRNTITQCYRCQRFGHAQSRCKAHPKCVKCGEDHQSYDCNKSRQEPATCANCGKAHPANYRGCEKFPKLPAHRTPANNNTTVPKPKQQTISYAHAAQTATAAQNGIQEQLQTFQKMYLQMQKIAEQIQNVLLPAMQFSNTSSNVQ